jgi:acylphosphatase
MTVEGRVQGVGYRAFTLKAAGQLGITGGVQNLPDGRVEILAEGPRVKLDELLKILRQGPPLSRVSDVLVQWHDATSRFPDFQIWY